MRQFLTIFSFEIKQYFKNKIFVGVTLLLVVLIAGVMFFPRISESLNFGDDSEIIPSERAVMLVKSTLPENTELMREYFSAVFKDYEVRSESGDIEQIKNKITSKEAECAFVLTSADSYVYYVNDLSLYDANSSIAEAALMDMCRIAAMQENGMTQEQAASVLSIQIKGTTENLGVNQMQNYWYTYIMIFALYMVILLYGQLVATNVASEKSSRAMEILITSAKPVNMMFGKVFASCFAGLLQLVSIFGSAILFYSLNKSQWSDNYIIASMFDMPLRLLAYMLIYFILGFFVYAFMFGAVGSTASKLEDINTSVMPITMLFIISFFVVMYSLATGDVDNMLMKVCSFVPFTSSMAMFTRIAMSNVPWYEIAASIAVLIGSVLGVGVISAKIYRVGVLLYGTTPKIGAVIKAALKA